MNVLIYELQSKLQDLVEQLRVVKDISIYFAFNDQEFKEVTANFHPHIIFVNNIVEKSMFKYDLENNRDMSIYLVDESFPKLRITEFPTHKKMSLKKIFK